MTILGHKGILTYVNYTSPGMSGGPVIQIQKKDNHYWKTNKFLVGIHVAGHLQQSKCTLLLKSNLDWINTIYERGENKNEDLYKNLSLQDRILSFVKKLENFKNEILIIEDLEIFSVTSKLLSLLVSKNTNIKMNSIYVNLKLKYLGLKKEKIQNRFENFINIFNQETLITRLNLENNDFDSYSIGIFCTILPKCTFLIHLDLHSNNLNFCMFTKLITSMKNTQIKILNLENNKIHNFITTEENELKNLKFTNIQELNLSKNEISTNDLSVLLIHLQNSKIENLNLSENKIFSIDENMQCLITSNIKKLNLNENLIIFINTNVVQNLIEQKNDIKIILKNNNKILSQNLKPRQRLDFKWNTKYITKIQENLFEIFNILPKTCIKFLKIHADCGGIFQFPKNIENLIKTKIQNLEFNFIRMNYAELEKLFHILPNTNIKKLKFEINQITKFPNNFNLVHIEEFILNGNGISIEECSKLFQKLKNAKHLKNFTLIGNKINLHFGDEEESITSFIHTKIEELNLQFLGLTTNDISKIFRLLPQINLKTLNLSNNRFALFPENIENLMHTQIKCLYFTHVKLNSDECSRLFEFLPKTIETLFLCNNKIKTFSKNSISHLRENVKKLKILNLKKNKIDSNGFSKLLKILLHTNVEILDVSLNQITYIPQNIHKLVETKIENLNLSTSLNVHANYAQIEKEEWKKLIHILPHTNIHALEIVDQIKIEKNMKEKICQIINQNKANKINRSEENEDVQCYSPHNVTMVYDNTGDAHMRA